MNSFNEIPIHSHDNIKQDNQTVSNNIDFISMTKRISNQNESINDFRSMVSFYIIVLIAQHISYASYSINFFLYSFCGIKFRRELIRCLSEKRPQVPRSRSTTLQNTI
jgi:hypothetical protein